jgi:Oligosaccharide biosynthesis protein Alg14 like
MWHRLGAVTGVILLRAVMMAMQPEQRRRGTQPVSTMVVLGSGETGLASMWDAPTLWLLWLLTCWSTTAGGHTAEMLKLLGALQLDRYSPRSYVVASTDAMGTAKAQAFEQQRQQDHQQRSPRQARWRVA